MGRSKTSFTSESRQRQDKNLHHFEKETNAEDGCNIDLPTNAGDASSGISQKEDWREGRRVVELGFLADNLICGRCAFILNLRDILHETRFGLGSILHVKCHNCSVLKRVPTGKRHMTSESDQRIARCFDVNTKLAAAMLNAGIGESQVNNILAALNIPQVSHRALKEREREIGMVFEKIAEESCDQAICEERELMERLQVVDSDVEVKEEASIDGGWQRRGTGHIRNSRSGKIFWHVTVIGKHKKKVISYGVAKKDCRKCTAKQMGRSRKSHKCRKNWSGSAKAMEPYLAVKCLQHLKQKGFEVKKIIMDDDTTALNKARQFISPSIMKSSDSNHVMKNFSSELLTLKTSHKLSQMTIRNISKDFSYAVKQNSDSIENLKNNLDAIIPHAFGNHEYCSRKWCRYDDKGEEYAHSSLPYGKDLTGESLRHDLGKVITKYTTVPMLEKLANLQSSNSNENLNHMIARKAPKSLHYSTSESLDFRVAAAVSQKNDGTMYMTKVNEAHLLSPGKFTEQRFQQLDSMRSRRSTTQNTVEKKKRRLELKALRSDQTVLRETLEGTTYHKAIDCFGCDDETTTASIPLPLIEPAPVSITDPHMVFFDVETTGFGTNAEIIQLAAKLQSSEDCINLHIMPSKKKIPNKITSITGLEVHGTKMYHNLEQVDAKTSLEALEIFLDWIRHYQPCVLLAHNAAFDARMIIQECNRIGLSLNNSIAGFVDTLPLFKSAFPGRTSYRQESLVNDILDITDGAHDALEDVDALRGLYMSLPKNKYSDINDNVMSVERVQFNIARLHNEKEQYPSFQEMIIEKKISKAQAKRIAGAGISLRHLEIVHGRSRESGIKTLLRDVIPSNYVKTCQHICQFFESKLSR